MSKKSADFYTTVQKVAPRKSFVIHKKDNLCPVFILAEKTFIPKL